MKKFVMFAAIAAGSLALAACEKKAEEVAPMAEDTASAPAVDASAMASEDAMAATSEAAK